MKDAPGIAGNVDDVMELTENDRAYLIWALGFVCGVLHEQKDEKAERTTQLLLNLAKKISTNTSGPRISAEPKEAK
jgi:hypothetical protein